ncbi:hypothetical protein BVC80_111g6 [Macleaya cordata]|uniref:Uncharacterized protein n=1 Tax=Macleaya cordata TaxID=56857 RepID=A0A200QR44_MACCD|nr:hypothetical protein BVC80_111g6 [Macleaya cordata]
MQSIWEAKGRTGSNSCRSIIAKRDIKAPPKSYFLNISITTKKSRAFNESAPKVRIKIPKLLVESIKKKQHEKNGTDVHKTSNINNSTTVKKLVDHKKLLSIKKVTSLLSNVIHISKKSSVTRNTSKPGRNAEECQRRRISTEDIFTKKTSLEDFEWSESSTSSSTMSLKSGDQPFSHPPKICDLLKERVEINEEDVNQFGFNPEHAKQIITTYKLPSSKVKMAFKSFFNKRTPFNFITGKSNSRSNSSNIHNSCGRGIGFKEEVYCKSSLKIQTAKEGDEDDCKELCKKKILLGMKCQPLNFTGIKTAKEEDEDDCKELCKKKILLGERCRPLNFTGVLY